MALTVTASITASIPISGQVTIVFKDTTSGVSGLVSRTLQIYDANSNLLDTVNMGATLTASYNITADMYLTFVETIVDGSGSSVGTFNYVSTSFYQSVFAPAVAAIPSQCADTFGVIYNLTQAELNKNAAIDMALFGQGVPAQALITQANFYVNTPYYS